MIIQEKKMDNEKVSKAQDDKGQIVPDLYDRIKAAAEKYAQGDMADLPNIIYTLVEACNAAEVAISAAAACDPAGDGKMLITGGERGRAAMLMACFSELIGSILQDMPPEALELTLRVFIRRLSNFLPYAAIELETRQEGGPRKKGS